MIHRNGTGTVLAQMGGRHVRIEVMRHGTEWLWRISLASGRMIAVPAFPYKTRDRMIADLSVITQLEPSTFDHRLPTP